jgi:hypothetical protein
MPTPADLSRTYGLHIYTPLGTDYRIEVEREDVRTYENGDKARVGSSRVLRNLSALVAKPLPGGPVTLSTYGELAALISAAASELAAEDKAAAEAAPVIPEVSDP